MRGLAHTYDIHSGTRTYVLPLSLYFLTCLSPYFSTLPTTNKPTFRFRFECHGRGYSSGSVRPDRCLGGSVWRRYPDMPPLHVRELAWRVGLRGLWAAAVEEGKACLLSHCHGFFSPTLQLYLAQLYPQPSTAQSTQHRPEVKVVTVVFMSLSTK